MNTNYLRFTAGEDGTQIGFIRYRDLSQWNDDTVAALGQLYPGMGSIYDEQVSIEYSTDDGTTWQAYALNTDNDNTDGALVPVTLAHAGDSVLFRGRRPRTALETAAIAAAPSFGPTTAGEDNPVMIWGQYLMCNRVQFCCEGTVAATGDIRTLWNYEEQDEACGCYAEMFYGCTGLTTAPELPATTLSPVCYYEMFYGCTGLTVAPELPATTLSPGCYTEMFNGCTGIAQIDLSAPTAEEFVNNFNCVQHIVNGTPARVLVRKEVLYLTDDQKGEAFGDSISRLIIDCNSLVTFNNLYRYHQGAVKPLSEQAVRISEFITEGNGNVVMSVSPRWDSGTTHKVIVTKGVAVTDVTLSGNNITINKGSMGSTTLALPDVQAQINAIPNATTTERGMMSAADKQKLSTLESSTSITASNVTSLTGRVTNLTGRIEALEAQLALLTAPADTDTTAD